jgi:hypothetical protein
MSDAIAGSELSGSPRKGHTYSTQDLTWTKCQQGWALYCVGRKEPVLHVIPDEKYPGLMWRIRRLEGPLSDMVNLTRARDGAISVALGILNGRRGG